MKWKEVFIEKCKRKSIDKNKFKYGRGSSRNDSRYKLTIKTDILPFHMYAIQYCNDCHRYIAWRINRNDIPQREVYTVKADGVLESLNSDIIEIGKAVEFSGWNEEDVISFNEDGIDMFLKKYCMQ